MREVAEGIKWWTKHRRDQPLSLGIVSSRPYPVNPESWPIPVLEPLPDVSDVEGITHHTAAAS